jgi:hypothetical protein
MRLQLVHLSTSSIASRLLWILFLLVWVSEVLNVSVVGSKFSVTGYYGLEIFCVWKIQIFNVAVDLHREQWGTGSARQVGCWRQTWGCPWRRGGARRRRSPWTLWVAASACCRWSTPALQDPWNYTANQLVSGITFFSKNSISESMVWIDENLRRQKNAYLETAGNLKKNTQLEKFG